MTDIEIREIESQRDEVDEKSLLMEKNVQIKLFGKYSFDGLTVKDMSLEDMMAYKPQYKRFIPHSAGRYQVKRFRKIQCPIVERFVNGLMYHGRNTGKKAKAIRILMHTFELIHLLTGENPIQILLDAIVNSGPREDSTKVGKGGGARREAVDVSPLRRVNVGISFLITGARKASFRKSKTFSECLADELINAAKNNQNSFAVKKKEEIERISKSNR